MFSKIICRSTTNFMSNIKLNCHFSEFSSQFSRMLKSNYLQEIIHVISLFPRWQQLQALENSQLSKRLALAARMFLKMNQRCYVSVARLVRSISISRENKRCQSTRKIMQTCGFNVSVVRDLYMKIYFAPQEIAPYSTDELRPRKILRKIGKYWKDSSIGEMKIKFRNVIFSLYKHF